MELKKQKVKNN